MPKVGAPAQQPVDEPVQEEPEAIGFTFERGPVEALAVHICEEVVFQEPLNLFTWYPGGVYLIINRVTNKVYVGSTSKPFSVRWGTHRSFLRRGTHGNRYLQASWNKHGESAFEFLVLERRLPEDCWAIEQRWMDFHKSLDREFGYNLGPAGKAMLGMKHGSKVKKKISDASKRAWNSEGHREMMSAKMTGRKRSEEFRKRMSEIKRGSKNVEHFRAVGRARKGIPLDEEHKKMAVAAAKKGRVMRWLRRDLLCLAWDNKAEELLLCWKEEERNWKLSQLVS